MDDTEPPSRDIDLLVDRYRSDTRAHGDGSAWVMVNMIASIDGAVAVDGLSGALGNDADFAVFMTLRRLCDVVLVGAGTAAAEGYRPPSFAPDVIAARTRRGQAPRPTIAVVTRRLSIDLDDDLFADPTYRPAVVTTTDADPDRVAAIAERADIVTAGTGSVDLGLALEQLAAGWGPLVLAEGGPTLNADLVGADLVDEFCVTVSPLAVGGPGGRMLADGPDHPPRRFRVDRAQAAGGHVFTRYLRDHDDDARSRPPAAP